MSKILVVAEKPSVARDYAKVLGCNIKRDGYIEGEEYMVTWAIGHLVSLAEPHHYDKKYKTWKMGDLPIKPDQFKLRVLRKVSKQFNVIKSLMNDNNVDLIICGTDSGREGELIFRYIYTHAKCKKPFKRLWISSMTDVAIRKGFQNMKDGKDYDKLYFSAKCRSESDWLVGMNASRAFTLKYNALLSIGRVQTPTLAILVQRQHEIDNFKPVDYFEVVADFGEFEGTWIDDEKNTKINKLEEASSIIQRIVNKEGDVRHIDQKEKKLPPPLLYDLTELQRDANKRFGYTAKQTLNLAQDLYEKRKLITYPRTDSRYLTTDMKQEVKETLDAIKQGIYKTLIDKIGSIKFSTRIINDKKVTDHHAIIPTNKAPNLAILTKDEKNIYDLIVARLIEAFYPPNIEQHTEVILHVDEDKFIVKGKIVTQLGFKEVKIVLFGDKLKDDQLLPVLHVGDHYKIINSKMNKKQTTPPKLYTEASLLSAMEHAGKFVDDDAIKERLKELGLGTPATRAAVIERLIKVGYIKRKKKALIPTEKGINLIALLPDEIKTPEMTGKWERGLKRIAEGTMSPGKFMNSINRYVDFLISYAINEKKDITFKEDRKTKGKTKSNLGPCPKCQEGNVLENTKAYYCSQWKSGCDLTIWKNSLEQYGITLDQQLIKELMQHKELHPVHMTLPQTMEKCSAKLHINEKGELKLLNVVRQQQN